MMCLYYIYRYVIAMTAVVYINSVKADTRKLPNVLLIYVDNQGWTGTSVQMDLKHSESKSDYYNTDNLMRLASRSVRFSNAYASSPVCSPSRISIQTGKSPAQLGMMNIVREPKYVKRINANPDLLKKYQKEHMERKLIEPDSDNGINKEEITIAEFKKSEYPEYITGHFGKWHLGSGGPGYHGYDEHDGDTWNSNGQVEPPNPKDTFGISQRAIKFLNDRVIDKRPFYLQISYYAVHKKVIALDNTIKKYASLPAGNRHSNAAHAAF